MVSSTSDSLPSSPSLSANAVDQEFSSVEQHHGLFLPSPMYLDSSFQGFIPTPISPPPHPPAPSKPPKKRPRASRRPPTTVLTTDTSNFRSMVQEFTGFPTPPFATGQPPSTRPRISPFLLRSSPLKYQHNPALLPPMACNNTTTCSGTSSIVEALGLFARTPSGAMMPAATSTARESGADQYGGGMGGFNPFDDFEGEENSSGGGHGFFSSSLGGADKYDRH